MSDRFVTVITDASWVHQTSIASWAGATISNIGRRSYSGKVQRPTYSSNEAELFAIINTIYCMTRDKVAWKDNMGWLIQTDNDHCVNLLNYHYQDPSNRTKPRKLVNTSTFENEGLSMFDSLREEFQPHFILCRHVKGHLKASERDPKHWVQEEMDRAATRARKF